MKKLIIFVAAACLSLGVWNAGAQLGNPGRASSGPSFDAATGKLFGDNQTFSASVEFQITDPATTKVTLMPGKLSYDAGKSRFEMNLTEVKGGNFPPNAAAQMKAMGMDSIVSIRRPDDKTSYLIYPGMQSYVQNPVGSKTDDMTADDFKIETTAIGRETFDGHDCVKNKVVVTDKDGAKHDSILWNAADVNKFPVKIETTEQGRKSVMIFKNITFSKPDAGTFEVPANYAKYSTLPEMMQAMIAKKMGNMMVRPPGQ